MSSESLPVKKHSFPVGTSSFAQLVRRDNGEHVNYFIDKTLFIQRILEDPNTSVSLFPRFRRSGKSMNLDMLRCFFDIREREANHKLFQGLKIEKAVLANHEPCMKHQGQYPVIFLDFKKLSQSNFNEMYEQFKILVSELCEKHKYLIDSAKLDTFQKERIQAIRAGKANDGIYKNALKFLMQCLSLHYDGSKNIVLIDEYDVPFQRAIHQELYGKEKVNENYLAQLKDLFSVFLGDALKGNDAYLQKCIMTGIVRIAGAGVFSQLNNLTVYTIFDKPFSDCFGFTKVEVEQLVEAAFYDHPKKKEFMASLEGWYNGYRFGDVVIYNPWSVINACSDLKQDNIKDINYLKCYWLDTSNNELVRDKILNARNTKEAHEINETIAQLLSGGEVKKTINANLIFDSRIETIEHMWILLISTGYLKVTSFVPAAAGMINCSFAIPNVEVKSIYEQIFKDWIVREGIRDNSPLIAHLLKGNAKEFCEELEKFFKTTISVRDTSERKQHKKSIKDEKEDESYEAYYHGFMVGILGLSIYGAEHKVTLTSNRESGYGYYDLQLEPKNPTDPVYNKAVIFEFKRCLEEKHLDSEAKAALKQIKEREYETNLKERGIRTIVLIGVAFHKKRIKYQYTTLNAEQLRYKQPLSIPHSLFTNKPNAPVLSPATSKLPSLLSPKNPSPAAAATSLWPFFKKPSAAKPQPIALKPAEKHSLDIQATGPNEPEKKKSKLSLSKSARARVEDEEIEDVSPSPITGSPVFGESDSEAAHPSQEAKNKDTQPLVKKQK
jgi:hypothetical protein